MQFEFDWVDAFTTRAFGGNPCVVVHGAGDLDVDRRMALVRETRLSECAYLVGSDVADFGARYYLANREIPMAGHPTVATVLSLLDRGLVATTAGRADFTLEVGAGVLPIRVTGADGDHPVITMTQAAPAFQGVCDGAEIAAIFGLDPACIVGAPELVTTGSAYAVTLLKGAEDLRAARLDVARLRAWQAGLDRADSAGIEPFLVTLGAEGCDSFARLLLPPPLPPEDPFTGSATGTMAAYLWARGHLDTPEFVAGQGDWMGRPGRAQVRVLGPRDGITGIEVGGSGDVLMRGELRL